ncbi:histone H1-like [Aedes aegypti]|uniref:Uncharacterized protein n=1 Tax=Aedes aegypti TaxID=7159 RepID=A0A6I8U117_AEDAE|nr:histone H1-like [Aedes aegypti]
MGCCCIKTLKERNGSFPCRPFKKYIAANYKCDVAKLAPIPQRGLGRMASRRASSVQTNGTRRFPFVPSWKAEAKEGRHWEKKPRSQPREESQKPAAAKKAKLLCQGCQKAGGVKKAAAPKQKATKPSQDRRKKPKTPKPKKAAPAKKAAAKKTAAKK